MSDGTPNTKSSRMGRIAAHAVLLLAVGVGGYWLGARTGRAPLQDVGNGAASDVATIAPELGPIDLDRALEAALGDSWVTALRLTGRVQALEALLAELDGLIEEADQEGEKDPRPAARRVLATAINGMGEWELRSILSAVTRISDEELGDIEDLHGYSTRLAEIAAAGVLFEEADDPSSGSGPGVFFTGEMRQNDPESFAESEFTLDQEKIYANFALENYDGDRVLIKWSHSDSSRIHLLQNYVISRSDPYGWVWLRPTSGWRAGAYRVEVFSGDEALRPLATGTYRVSGS